MSFFIVDGPNGAGKTSLIKSLKSDGYSTISSPNETPLSKILRPACRGTEPWTDIDPRVQFLLFSASRYDEYVRIAHQKDHPVIADRWWTSTFVYQCVFQGFSVDFLEHTVHPEEKVDAAILLDADNNVLIERVNAERESNPLHGKCRWTQDDESIIRLADIYRIELNDYLLSKGIKVITIDATKKSLSEVKEEVTKIIGDYDDRHTIN
tara:strand:- start:42856 stop:43482 length:627 start_codon:yes stop_codon:yes gene_type:complete